MKGKKEFIIVGMALFAMFFGAGNLIYPLFVGTVAKNMWALGAAGFLIAAVLLPFLGVIAMVLFKGDYNNFFNILGKRWGSFFNMLILTVWIPLGGAPRCIALAYSSVSAYVNIGPIWVFGLIYSFLVFYVICRKISFIDFLGKIITPLLIGSIVTIFIFGCVYEADVSMVNNDFSFFKSLFEGYNTMDLIASFFFSSSIINILYKKSKSMTASLKMILKASVVGMALLAIIYILLIFISSKYCIYLQDVKKEQLLAHLSKMILGSRFSIVALLAIILACFSTSIALVVAYNDFLRGNLFKNQSNKKAMIFTLFISFIVSLFGLKGITFITSPILEVCYPILLVLIVINIGKVFVKKKIAIRSKSVEAIDLIEQPYTEEGCIDNKG